MQQIIKVIGLDAAFANTGIVLGEYDIHSRKIVVNELRLVQTAADKANKKIVRKNSDDLRRAKETINAIDQAIADHDAAFIFCEVPFGAQSARAAWSLGIAVGIIAHANSKVPVIQVTPKEVKNVVGEKFPDKAQMIAWAAKQYPDANWPMQNRGGKQEIVAGKAEHMADAVATIHAGIATDEFQRTIAMFRVMR